jgi:hypothetical protein
MSVIIPHLLVLVNNDTNIEPWHCYLSEAKLKRLEREVFRLVDGARAGEVPLGLNERNKELRQLRRSLHVQATRRHFEEVRGSYDDPTR